jgi:ferrous iron transport protein A
VATLIFQPYFCAPFSLRADQLNKGQKAIIISITESPISNKLLEMGCVPGTRISLEFFAPGKDPIAFNIDGYVLGLRRSEAAQIEVNAEL